MKRMLLSMLIFASTTAVAFNSYAKQAYPHMTPYQYAKKNKIPYRYLQAIVSDTPYTGETIPKHEAQCLKIIVGLYSFYNNYDYSRAVRLLTKNYANHSCKEVRKGEPEYVLGSMFDQGLGVLENKEQAMKYYKKCAYLGNSVCAYNIGVNYALQGNYEGISWLKVSHALGKEIYYNSNHEEKSLSTLISGLNSLVNKYPGKSNQVNSLAKKICLSIPSCVQ